MNNCHICGANIAMTDSDSPSPPPSPPELDQDQFRVDAAKWRLEWLSRIERAAYGAKMVAEMLTREYEAAKLGSTSFNRYADPIQQICFDLSNQIGELKAAFDSYLELRWPTLYSDEQ